MSSSKFFIKLIWLISLFLLTSTHIVEALDKITGPWLWMIAPTELLQGGAHSTNVDSLAAASGGAVTEADVAANGVNEGDACGNFKWTLADIDSTNGSHFGNVNDVVNRIGWATGDVDDHSSYALITLESDTDQRVRMVVGSDDSIKVWFNGEVVHNNSVDRSSTGFQDLFFVNLVAGDNLLLVKVSEHSGGWVMFVGIDADVNAVYKPRDTVLSISPFPVVSPPVGKQFVVSVDIANGRNIAGYQLALAFDPTALRYVAALQTTGYLPPRRIIVAPQVSRNSVTLAATSFGEASGGDGALAHITFEVVAYKESTLILDTVKVLDSEGNALPVSVENGKVLLLYGDVDNDGVVNIRDLVLVANSFGKTGQTSADINKDGVVDITDLVLVAGAMKTVPAAPSLHTHQLDMLSVADLRYWLAQADQFHISDARYRDGILVLKHLLGILTPRETVLLPNYPNPFNPETWIPYQLATPAEVKVAIYAVDGTLVRTLALGHQPAGVYQGKGRAVYWNGRNALGEPVASGVYFYTLTVGEFRATRKLLIRK